MKLLVCRYCLDWNALSWGPRECWCGRTGGKYNHDGDTATVWGDGVLFGFNNRVWKPVLVEHLATKAMPEVTQEGKDVLWLYDESNGKITRLEAKPEEWKRPSERTNATA